MPPKGRRGHSTSNAAGARGARRGRGRGRTASVDPAASPYQELLAEVNVEAEAQAPERPLKRRKRAQDRAPAESVVGARKVDVEAFTKLSPHVTPVASPVLSTADLVDEDDTKANSEDNESATLSEPQTPPGVDKRQIVYDDTESSEESDADFERLILQGIQGSVEDEGTPQPEDTIRASAISSTPRVAPRTISRKHAKAKDKIIRVDMHKVSILCWLMHGHFRNSWCNNTAVRNCLRQVLSVRQRAFLNPDPSLPQNEQSLLFQRGLDEACKAFQEDFRINRSEARTREDLIEAAGRLRGSRHTGNQLFCALLRDAGVRARLVCSLQVTKLTSIVPINDIGMSNKDKPVDSASYSNIIAAADSDTASDGSTNGRIQPIKRRLGQRSSVLDERRATGATPTSSKRASETLFSSPYPIYWIEAFSVSNQRWLCIDPLVTKTWNKPRRLEPPLYDEENTMTYVFAYDTDVSVKDVTRRYAKSYNAKTYKRRIESTPGGTQWLRRALRTFRQMQHDDADQIEDAELARYEAAEPIPNAQQDFKGHPVYALERHLRHNEVIHPRREVGKVVIGKKQEPIYRRSDVQTVHSSDKWYRSLGRQLRVGEQPLKYGKPRRRRTRSVDDDELEEEAAGVGLYAEFQTQLYVPPQVVDGKIQKNIYGNLDVYVPSMIPAGAAHIRCSDGAHAARLAGVDYAEAVTGFQFKGRKGTAITRGVIVAREYSKAVEAICHGLREAREAAAAAKQSTEALKLWKKFLLGLRIREHVMDGADPNEDADKLQQRIYDAADEEEEIAGEGGFFLEREPESAAASNAHYKETKMAMESNSEVDEIIEAMNRDTGLSGSKGGQAVRREYFEPTLFSPWDIPEQDKNIAERPLQQAHPPLTTEMTTDSLFTDPPGEAGVEQSHGVTDNPQDEVRSLEGGFIVGPSPSPAPRKAAEEAVPNYDGQVEAAHDGTSLHATTERPDLTQAQMDAQKESAPSPQPNSSANDSLDRDSDMLSHDPEEDDMEEGWLVEETGI